MNNSSVLTKLFKIFTTVFLFGIAPLYWIIWFIWRIFSYPIGEKLYVYGDDLIYATYQKTVLFLCEYLSGIKVILYGDIDEIFKKKENAILLSNHQCTCDWMVGDMLADRQGSIGHLRYILKDSLKYIPLYGFYWRQHSCIYVKRSGNFEQVQAKNQLKQLANADIPFWMIIFPEGHRYNALSDELKLKNQAFLDLHGLPSYQHLLTPRMKALNLIFDELGHKAHAVYDTTIAYSSTLQINSDKTSIRVAAPTLSDMLDGKLKTLHVHISRIPIEDVPLDDRQKFEKWLYSRFQFKDELLKQFYSGDISVQGKFDNTGRHYQLPITKTLPSFLLWSAFVIWFIIYDYGLYLYLAISVFSLAVSYLFAIFFM